MQLNWLYIKEKGYEQNIKILVAFSGKVVDDNFPEGVTEPQLTGFGEKELPRVFAQVIGFQQRFPNTH